MASVTTGGSGDWNSTTVNAPWPGGTIPAATDTIIIANGHTLTVPAGYTAQAGASGAPTTPAVATAGTGGTGILIVNGTLQVQADLQQGNATWTIGADGIIEFANTTTLLNWYTGDGAGQAPRVVLTGTSGAHRATIRAGTGSAGWRVRNDFGGIDRNNNGWTVDWGNITGGGSAAVPAIRFSCAVSGCANIFRDTLIDSCGQIFNNAASASGANVEWRRVKVSNALDASYAINLQNDSTASPAGTRIFQDVAVTSKVARFLSAKTIDFTRCVFLGGIENGAAAAFTDCVIGDYASPPTDTTLGSNVTRGFRVKTDGGGNWHGLYFSTTTAVTVDGLIYDGVVSDDLGDLLQLQQAASALVHTVKNVLTTKAPTASGSYGKLIGGLGVTSNASVGTVVHNTYYSQSGNTEGSLVNYGEAAAGYSGMYGAVGGVKGNLVIGAVASGGVLVGRDTTGTVTDAVAPANIANNVVRNALADTGPNYVGIGNRTQGAKAMFTSPPPTPVDVDPQLVDDTRNLATWYRSVVGGSAGTRQADMLLALDGMVSQVTDAPTAGLTIAAAYTWIRAGFAPQNVAVQIATDNINGNWAGAVTGQEPSGVRSTPYWKPRSKRHSLRR